MVQTNAICAKINHLFQIKHVQSYHKVMVMGDFLNKDGTPRLIREWRTINIKFEISRFSNAIQV